MGLGGILQELKTEGVLALYIDFRSGRLFDWSGNGHNCISPAPNFFTKQALSANGAASPSINNTAMLQAITTGTLIASQKVFPTTVNSYFFYKAPQIIWNHAPGSNAIFFSSNVTTAQIAYTAADIATHGVNFDSAGSLPVAYKNGVFVGTYSVGVAVISSANNVSSVAATNSSISTLTRYLLMFSRKLTATEHARVYGQLENMRWNTKGLTPGLMMP
jgi:hypothetical protein